MIRTPKRRSKSFKEAKPALAVLTLKSYEALAKQQTAGDNNHCSKRFTKRCTLAKPLRVVKARLNNYFISKIIKEASWRSLLVDLFNIINISMKHTIYIL